MADPDHPVGHIGGPAPRAANGYVTQREHDLLDDKVERYFDMLTTELQKAEQNRKDALTAAAMTIQTGLDKAERTLQISLDKAERNLQVALEAAEKRVNEKFVVQKEAVEKAESVLTARLATFDRFREEISGERALYVTKDQLDLILKSVQGDLQPMRSRAAWTSGAWAAVCAMAALVLALLSLLIPALKR